MSLIVTLEVILHYPMRDHYVSGIKPPPISGRSRFTPRKCLRTSLTYKIRHGVMPTPPPKENTHSPTEQAADVI